jgi:hypothetical protein
MPKLLLKLLKQQKQTAILAQLLMNIKTPSPTIRLLLKNLMLKRLSDVRKLLKLSPPPAPITQRLKIRKNVAKRLLKY